MDTERALVASAFPGDDGQAAAATRSALAEASGPTPDSYLRAIAQLCTDRLLVPVVATATRLAGGQADGLGGTAAAASAGVGLTSDKEAEMSVVLLQSADGRRAMLAFTGMDSLRAWDAQARPVPVTLDLAAESAQADGAVALLIDFAGPHPLVIEGELLAELARGHRLVEVADGGFGWAIVPPRGD